ncbi:hypothetical protein ABEF91_007361 [Exophiala dermatitidis]
MSMFHRRSRSASASRPQTPASASAHLAATQAFLANRTSQGNLSASAAAAALRSMTPTPTPVENVQTKRTIQRQASLSALSSSGRGRSRGGLQRQTSAGSMTERTFRTPSPSPSRPPSRPQPVEHPPLPNIPQQYAGNVTAQKPKKTRAVSQGAPPTRVVSPPPTRPVNRGQSVDRYRQPEQPLPNTNAAATDETQPTDSRNSINFSRPLSPLPRSPSGLTNGERAPTSVSANAIAPAEAEEIQHNLRESANQPVKKKKKKVAPGSTEGSHLHGGTMASKPVVTPLEPVIEPQGENATEQPPQAKKKKKKKSALSGQDGYHAAPDSSSRTDSDSDSTVGSARDRRANRASGMLTKQPSIVREDWEGEQNEEAGPAQTLDQDLDSASTLPNKRSVNAANVSRKIEEPNVPSQTVNQLVTSDVQAGTTPAGREQESAASRNLRVVEPRPARGTSLSPSRSTRFSERLSSDLAAGQKHEPPPRSVSPAKPALKHHSPSPRMSPSDPYARGSSVTPSEASDISSISADGAPRRKKSVRVSFESEPEVVGIAASASSAESSKPEKKTWLPKARPALNTIESNDDMEELMKPRPQLPSFGSIRGQSFRETSESPSLPPARPSAEARTSAPVKEKGPTSSEASANVRDSTSYTTGVSSDHAVGAILANEAKRSPQPQSQGRTNEPLPPEVTSVEGVVSFSDSESEGSEDGGRTETSDVNRQAEGQRDTVQGAKQTSSLAQQRESNGESTSRPDVPVLSISPPTPGLEQGATDDGWIVEIPGGFPTSTAAESTSAQEGRDVYSTSDEDSDNDSIYSDAAEDPSELDGTGFGSIDAIVDSPVVPVASILATAVPETPLARPAQPQRQEPVRESSWQEAQARWKNIAQQTRQGPALDASASEQPQVSAAQKPIYSQVTQQQPSSAPPPSQAAPQAQRPQPPPEPPRQQASQPRRKKKTQASIAAGAASAPATAGAVQRNPQSTPRTNKPASATTAVSQPRSSAKAATAAAAAAPFRQSMRGNAPTEPEAGFRKSMRNTSMTDSGATRQQQRQSQLMTSSPAQQPRAALQKKHIPPAPAAVSPAAALAQRLPPMPIVANDSDSDSSFRKRRRRKSATPGQHAMRRSMRGAAEPTLRDTGHDHLRSQSPEPRRPFSPTMGARSMRTSMRGSMDSGVPTLRAAPTETKRSSSLFGRRQKSPPPVPAVVGFTHKARSRIADSDDEDAVPRTSKFRSRFADDSDDEVDTSHLTPVRGIPRRAGDDDSTDLEDSSEEEKPTVKTPPKLQIPANSAALSGEEPPLSPTTEKKRGLFGRLRGKKHKEEPSLPSVNSTPSAPKVDASKPSQLGFASAAERDRVIEQTRAKLEAAKDQPVAESPSSHAKLQRRHQPHRMMSDSWPLPPPNIQESGTIRPSTSDGAPFRNGSTRLTQGSMRPKEPPIEAVGRSGKKKKFPMLRKAFGLKD